MKYNISVIIPVHNVEKYLESCLDSILNQKFHGSFEVICVNDGSTDRSGEILDDYAKRYENVKIINQNVGWPAGARNAGLDAAQGEYILFSDSDDCILEGSFEILYNYAQKHNSDLVIFDYKAGRNNDNSARDIISDCIGKKYGENSFNIESVDPYTYRNIQIHVWNKLYRADLIKDLRFNRGTHYEDVPFWDLVFTHAKAINYLPRVCYFYRTDRQNSVMMNNSYTVFYLFKVYTLSKEILKNAGYYDKYKNMLYVRFARMIVTNLQTVRVDLRQKYVEFIKNFDWDVDYESYFKEDFYPFEKNNMKLIRYILEHDYSDICAHLEHENLWKKWSYDVSVVIPVYNVEKYLARCLNSVARQTFPASKYEIICVNDGSTDNSLKILEEYAKQYSNIKIINKENGGLSDARNEGMKRVKGKYVLFVDSDDFIALNALEVLFSYAQKHQSDVVVFEYYSGEPEKGRQMIHHLDNVTSVYEHRQFNAKTADKFVYRFIPVAAWLKFYKTDLIKDFEFVKGMYFEDVPYWDMVYTSAERINYLPYLLYYYDRSRDDNISSVKNDKLTDVFKTYNYSRKILKESGFYEKFKYIMYAHATCNMVNHLQNIDDKYKEKFINEIKNFEIDVTVDEFLKEDFYNFEYANFRLIKFIQENDLESVKIYLKYNNVLYDNKLPATQENLYQLIQKLKKKKTVKVNARELFLSQRRFDLIFKYLYLKYPNNVFVKNAYLENTRALCNFYEHYDDRADKRNPNDFIKSFNETYESIKNKGFIEEKGVIQLGKNLEIQNGAHRLAICAYLNKEIVVEKFEKTNFSLDYRFYYDKRMNTKIMDYGASEYMKLNPNAYIINLHLAKVSDNETAIEVILEKYGFIYYRKDKKPSNIRMYVFVCSSKENAEQAKKEIQQLCNVGEDCVYINKDYNRLIV